MRLHPVIFEKFIHPLQFELVVGNYIKDCNSPENHREACKDMIRWCLSNGIAIEDESRISLLELQPFHEKLAFILVYDSDSNFELFSYRNTLISGIKTTLYSRSGDPSVTSLILSTFFRLKNEGKRAIFPERMRNEILELLKDEVELIEYVMFILSSKEEKYPVLILRAILIEHTLTIYRYFLNLK